MENMTSGTEALDRKSVQVSPACWAEIRKRKSLKETQLAKQGRAREVTLGEVVADAFGVKT
jgi:hypothetical protein